MLGQMFSGITSDFSGVFLDLLNRDDLFHSGKEIFVTSSL